MDIHTPTANLTYRWLIHGDWKIILPNKVNVTTRAKEKGTGTIELYNLTKDPFEKNNLAASKHSIVKRLTRQLDKQLPIGKTK